MADEKLQTIEGRSSNGFISEDAFLKALVVPEVELEVPELGEGARVLIKPITMAEREKILSAARAPNGSHDNSIFEAMTLVFGMLKPKLSHDKIPALKDGNPKAVDRIAKAIWKLSGLDEEAAARKNA